MKNNINEYIKFQQIFAKKNVKSAITKKMPTEYNDQETKKNNFITDRINKKSPSPALDPKKIIKKNNLTPECRKKSVDDKKNTLNNVQKIQQELEFQQIEQRLDKFLDSQSEEVQKFYEQLGDDFPKYKSMFKKIQKINNAVQPKQDFLDAWILQQSSQNEQYINKQFEILLKENEDLKELMSQQRKDLYERMKKENMILEMLKALKENGINMDQIMQSQIQKKNKNQKCMKLNLDALSNQNDLKGFHQEFMQHVDEFSESWRKLAAQEKKH